MAQLNQSKMIPLHNVSESLALFGPQDKFLELIEAETICRISSREAEIYIEGPNEQLRGLQQLLETLLQLIRNGLQLNERDVRYALELSREMRADELISLFKGEITHTFRGKPVLPKTLGQRHYVTIIRKKDIVFGIGPAGTGKTYLAVMCAISALKEGRIKRIILTRPAVEAGENLGFLPGDLQNKVDPYLRPLYDALNDGLGAEGVAKAMERNQIEIAPLAYMRGRTLDDSFIILDEAQNTTSEQMKMFLTRMGFGSQMIITGDVTQIDLPKGKKSGLIEAEKILQQLSDVGLVYFSDRDVVRHGLVQKIILAYEAQDS